jgi:predicted dehydrogenase
MDSDVEAKGHTMSERDDKRTTRPAVPAGVSRRKFVTTVAGTGAALTIVPRHVLGRGFQAPSDTVNIATVGIGGMGGTNTRNLMSQNIVAIADVDWSLVENRFATYKADLVRMQNAAPPSRRRDPTQAQLDANARRPAQNTARNLERFLEMQLPKLQRYRDYREKFDKQKDIDAVVVATPDHMHAAVASAAMDLRKHVYVQKPLCWSVEEARHLARKAKQSGVMTQMGNQGHSSDGARLGYEYITGGAIGDVREVHVWTNRPLGYWPQGIPRPAPLPPMDAQRPLGWNGMGVEARVAAALAGRFPIPDQLSWDLFLGVAPPVEYHPLYHPGNWRGWVDWGQGALGDMGAHLIDHPFWSLNLGLPTAIETRSTPFNGVCYPSATTTHYEFPARGNMPAVKMTWHDGGFAPPKPDEIGDETLNGEGGILYIGSKGKMLQNTYGANPRLLPKSLHDSYGAPKPRLKRVAHEEHEMNWVEAIKGKAQISCPFESAAPLTEVMLLGVVALRAGGKIRYDGANRRVTNSITTGSKIIDPNEFLTREYRDGWKLA